MHSVAMSNIIFAVLFTDKYSITEIREQYGEQQHTKKSICNLFCFPSGFFRPLSYCILHSQTQVCQKTMQVHTLPSSLK